MKKRSFIRNLSIMLFMQFVLLTALFVALIVHMRNSAVTEMETAADNVLAIYRVNLENRIERANNILKNLTLSEETALEMIRSDKESDRYYAKKSIYTAMHAALLQDSAVDLLIVAENSYGGYMESTNGDSSKWALPYETRKAVETFTLELLGSGTDPAISNLCLALTDSNGYVWKTIGSELKNIPLGQTMQALGSNWKVNQLEIGDSSLYVTSYLNEYRITYTTQTSVLSVILIAIVALGCSAAIIFYTRRQIIKPMKDMTEKLHDMNGVTEGFQIQTSYGSQEFLVLRDTFNRMMRENVDLRLSAYKHHMEMQDSELRCIRLQLRPHFFLNAMTTISSLSMQGQNDSIKRYVEVLSKNIRYMFKSGMHTVPLSEEMQNVQYYYEMQELRYPGSVFYYGEYNKEDENWPIPQMLIHTVVENIYKHAVSVDNLITILVQVNKTEYKGQEMLCISIEDDGEGYPEEILKQFQAGEKPKPSEDGTHLGLWSLWEMLRIMYDRNDLMELKNAEPHGTRTIFYLPKEAINETGKKTSEGDVV